MVLTLLLGSLAACSGDSGDEEPETPDNDSGKAAAIETTTKVATVRGRLRPPQRRALVSAVTPVVDGWIDAAHVAGEWPRSIGKEAWAGFTPDAAALAAKDRALTSAAEISEQVDSVTATRRVVRYDVLAAGGRARGVTARVVLDYDTTGEVEKAVQVRGRLLLTPTEDGWKIFGFDLTEGER
ncbi:hypothetical protein [Nocardioides daphniae]|uniref:SnoaL-like domain-containing protein n=1 Tax=Nocardioides daphniae TaxID=402297 RepID=A0A4P7UC10_9ACTN|nr:hypothetical protein [Nocardioides daphniae]QCC77723.1 hypothetical protein E2C04_12010 [Nocardioides daphniae]GGD29066.1 hypothetical protein GCM10007231_30730 [Nocardioides daphniae]